MKKNIILITLLLILALSACSKPTPEIIETENLLLETVTENLSIESNLTNQTFLPLSINGVIITWESNTTNTLSSTFEIIQGLSDTDIILTAHLNYDLESKTKKFEVTIVRLGSVDLGIINNAKNSVSFDSYVLTDNIILPLISGEVAIIWTSNNDAYLDSEGNVYRPGEGEDDEFVTLTATFSYNELVITEQFTFLIHSTAVTVVYEGYYYGAENLEGLLLKNFLHGFN